MSEFQSKHAEIVMWRYCVDMAPETSTEVAEAYAIGEGCDDWLDDETHPVWDIAADVFEGWVHESFQAEIDDYERSEAAS